MKKIISFVLAAVLLVSAVPTALAPNDYSQGTQVVYEATGSESYTITVPAQLAPGGSGTVTLSGTWADNRTVTITADPIVTLTNSIKAEDQKVLNVNFDGISEAGSNTTSQTFTKDISVDPIEAALFGTWSGKFDYNVDTFIYDNVFPIQWNTKEVSESHNPKFTAAEMPFVKISDLAPDAESISNPTGSFEKAWQDIPMGIAYSVDGLTMYINTEGGIPFPLIIAYKAGEYEYEEEIITIPEPGMYFIDVYQYMGEWDDNCTFATN